MLYGVHEAAALNADIVINVEDENTHSSYICKLDPTRKDKSDNPPPLEEQPIWQIIFYQQIQVDETHVKLVTKYPNGLVDFRFKVSECENYNYEYRL